MSHRVRNRVLAVAGIAGALSLSSFGAVAQSRDFDCSDFHSHKQAQKFFKKHHPKQDPYGLDADNDGVACESLS
jgi:Excalibur calcium-binding domain